jgi:hypothetical protein
MNGEITSLPNNGHAAAYVPYSATQCVDILTAPNAIGVDRAKALNDLMSWIDAGQVTVQDLPPAVRVDVDAANVLRLADAEGNWQSDLSAVLAQLLQIEQKLKQANSARQALDAQQAADAQRAQGDEMLRSADDKRDADDAQAGAQIGEGAISAGGAVVAGRESNNASEAGAERVRHLDNLERDATPEPHRMEIAQHEAQLKTERGHLAVLEGRGELNNFENGKHAEHSANIAHHENAIRQIRNNREDRKAHWQRHADMASERSTSHGRRADVLNAWDKAFVSLTSSIGSFNAAASNQQSGMDQANSQYRQADSTAANERSRQAGESASSAQDCIKSILDMVGNVESQRAASIQRAEGNVG